MDNVVLDAYNNLRQRDEDVEEGDENSDRDFWDEVTDNTTNVPGVLIEDRPARDALPSSVEDNIYDDIFGRLPQDDQTRETEPANAVATKLYPHQKQALCWMIGKENNNALPPFWEEISHSFYNTITKEWRPNVDRIRGGILADDMGLGKTLEMISLIVTNCVDGKPLFCPSFCCDKVSSQQSKHKKDKYGDGAQNKPALIQSTLSFSKMGNETMLDLTPKRASSSRDVGSRGSSSDVDNSERVSKRTISQEEVEEAIHSLSKYARLPKQKPASSGSAQPTNIPYDALIDISDSDSVITILDSDEEELSNAMPLNNSRNIENDDLIETIQPSLQNNDDNDDLFETIVPSLQNNDENIDLLETIVPSWQNNDVYLVEDTTQGYDPVTGRCETNGPRGTLIICPTSVLSNWESQFKQHIDNRVTINLYVHYGPSRCNDLEFMMDQDVVITTYHTVIADDKKADKGPIYNTEWLRIVLDEGHMIRNPRTRTAKLIFELKAQRRWVLSGTPIQNSMEDLWSIINFLRVEPLTDKKCWNRTIAYPLSNKKDCASQRVFHLMRNLSLRRTKTQQVNGKPVLDLPARNVVLKKLTLRPEHRKSYDRLEKDGKILICKYIKNGTVQQHLYEIFVVQLRLRQFCCHPKLVFKAVVAATHTHSNSDPSLGNSLGNRSGEDGSSALTDNPICQICLSSPKNPVISSFGWAYCWNCYQVKTAQGQIGAFTPSETNAAEVKLLVDQLKSVILEEEECIICSYSVQDRLITSNGHVYCRACFLNNPDITQANEAISAAKRKSLIVELIMWLEADEEFKECPICYMKSTEIGHKMAVTTFCGHTFCGNCIEKLFESQPLQTCPICRKNLDSNMLIKVPKNLVEEPDNVDGWESGAKSEALLTALTELRQTDPSIKSIVVSQFTSFLDLIEKELREKNFVCVRLDGRMPQKKRKEAMQMFSDPGPDSPSVMLLSLKAGGVGINLIAASRVFLMDPAWNPAAEEQCFDRCHRLGQTRDVEITKFIIDNSVEENMLKLQDRKRKLMSGAFLKKLSKEERRINYINDLMDFFTDFQPMYE